MAKTIRVTKLTKAEKAARTVPASVNASARRAAVAKATARVKTRASISPK